MRNVVVFTFWFLLIVSAIIVAGYFIVSGTNEGYLSNEEIGYVIGSFLGIWGIVLPLFATFLGWNQKILPGFKDNKPVEPGDD